MMYLLLGMLIFFGVHLLPAFALRGQLIARWGAGRYRKFYILVAFVGLALMIYGKSVMGYVAVWRPPYWTRHLLMGVMPLALFFIALPDIPNNFRRRIRHPMMLGILVWSAGHLAANGDLASTLLFGSFLLYSIFSIISTSRRGPFVAKPLVPVYRDLITLVFVVVCYGVLFKFHVLLSGVALI